MTAIIRFYSTTDPYEEFSNFSRHSIFLDGKVWPTSGHDFQAQKFHDEAIRKQIRFAKTPMLAANLGRNRKLPLRRDWDSVKDNVMRKVSLAKFTQNRELKELLPSTGTAKLVEHIANDSYWADGVTAPARTCSGSC